jgi:hypothetical protein
MGVGDGLFFSRLDQLKMKDLHRIGACKVILSFLVLLYCVQVRVSVCVQVGGQDTELK